MHSSRTSARASDNDESSVPCVTGAVLSAVDSDNRLHAAAAVASCKHECGGLALLGRVIRYFVVTRVAGFSRALGSLRDLKPSDGECSGLTLGRLFASATELVRHFASAD